MRTAGYLGYCILGLLLVLFSSAGCRPPPLPERPAITVTAAPTPLYIGLSDSATTIETLVSEHYDQPDDRRKVQFITGNDATLLNDLERGSLDAALLYSVPQDTDLWFNPVALDGLVLLVHPENDVVDLSFAELQAIFSGDLNNWSSFGGTDFSIEVISREPGSGARTILEDRVLAGRPLVATALIAPNSTAMRKAIDADSGTIGFGMMGNKEDEKSLSVDGKRASPTSTASQDYPLTLPLYFVSSEEPQDELRVFLSWLQSSDGQSVLGDNYGRVR